MGDDCKMKKKIIFVILVNILFLSMSMKLGSIASIDHVSGIEIWISHGSNDDIDFQDIHVELMVLKSDFIESQTYASISEAYKALYPNYQNYTHLENDDEISYLAFIKGTTMSRYENEFFYMNEYLHENEITYLRLVVFSTDGTILARSKLFLHHDMDDVSSPHVIYEIDFDNLEFYQSTRNEFNGAFIALGLLLWLVSIAFLLVFMASMIWGVKTVLSSYLEIKYKKPVFTMIFDAVYINLGTIFIYMINFRNLVHGAFNTIFLASFTFFTWNFINFFLLIKKETRGKYWIIVAITQTIVGLIIWLIMRTSL